MCKNARHCNFYGEDSIEACILCVCGHVCMLNSVSVSVYVCGTMCMCVITLFLSMHTRKAQFSVSNIEKLREGLGMRLCVQHMEESLEYSSTKHT